MINAGCVILLLSGVLPAVIQAGVLLVTQMRDGMLLQMLRVDAHALLHTP